MLTPKLRRLGVAFIPALDKTLAQSVAQSCPALTALDLSGSGQHQTTLPWVSLMTGCRGLRELRLNGMGGASGWTPSPVRAGEGASSVGLRHTHTRTHTHVYKYVYMCIFVFLHT